MSTEYGVFYGDKLYDYPKMKVPIIEHMLYKNDAICISSKPGVGKSLLLMHLICNLTTGTPFLDLYSIPKPCNVLYIQAEGDRSETIERMGNFKLQLKCDDSKWVHINQIGLILNSDHGFSQLYKLALAPQMHFDVIMIDPLYATVQGDLSKNHIATEWQRNVRRLRSVWNSTLIITHHEHKESRTNTGQVIERSSDDLLGSFAWGAFFNHNFKFKKKGKHHHLIGGKQRSGKIIDEIVMKMEEPSPLYFTSIDNDTDVGERKVMVVLQENKRLTAKKLAEFTDISRSTIYRALKKLQETEKVKKIVEHGVSYYEWFTTS